MSSNLLSMAEADASNINSKNVPNVIKFVYDEFTSDQVKKIQTAKCRRCRAVIQEKQGTNSAFVRHLATAAHCQHQAQALSHLHNSQLPTSRSSLRYFLQKTLVVKELVFSMKNDSAPYDRWLVLCSQHQLTQLPVNVHSSMLV